jgi:hypothetical protein
MYTILWVDNAGQTKRTKPTARFLRALRSELGYIKQMYISTDLYFNDPRAALAAAQTSSSKTKGKQRALDLGDDIERQHAQRKQKQRSSGAGAQEEDEEEAPKKKKKSQ